MAIINLKNPVKDKRLAKEILFLRRMVEDLTKRNIIKDDKKEGNN